MPDNIRSGLSKSITNICITITIVSIMLISMLSLSIVKPSYSVDSLISTNGNNSNSKIVAVIIKLLLFQCKVMIK